MCWQLGEQRTGGAAIQRTGGAANRGSQHKRSNEPRGVPFTFCMFAVREIVSLLISTCLSVRFPFSYFCAEQIWRRGSVLFCTSSRKTSRLGTGLQIKSLNCTVDLTTVAGRGPRKDGWPSAGLRRSTRTQAVPVGRLLPPCLPSNLAIFLQEEEQVQDRRIAASSKQQAASSDSNGNSNSNSDSNSDKKRARQTTPSERSESERLWSQQFPRLVWSGAKPRSKRLCCGQTC